MGSTCDAHCPLSPQEAIALIPEWREATDLRVAPLPGGLMNLNYRVEVSGQVFALRIAGPGNHALGMDREAEVAASRATAEAGIGPAVVHAFPDRGVLVTEFIEGRILTAQDFLDPGGMRRVIGALHEIHALRAATQATFSPFERAARWRASALRLDAELPEGMAAIDTRMRDVEKAAALEDAPVCFCHNDPIWANWIDDGRLRVIDWEFGAWACPLFDLAIVSANTPLSREQEREMIRLYLEREPTAREMRRFDALCTAFDYYSAYWLVIQRATGAPIDCEAGLAYHMPRLAEGFDHFA